MIAQSGQDIFFEAVLRFRAVEKQVGYVRVTQRVILIAANFRKEVTSTVLWLTNFKLRVQCFKVTPYLMEAEIFLNIEQIIPTKDAEEFMIGLAEKAQDEIDGVNEEKNRHKVRRKFWGVLIAAMNEKSALYQNISPGTAAWIGAGSGTRGIGYNFAAGGAYGRAEVYIDRKDKELNKFIFDHLRRHETEIQKKFGIGQLLWERLDDKQACRIKAEISGNIFDEDEWPVMIEFMVDAMQRLQKAFEKPLAELTGVLKAK